MKSSTDTLIAALRTLTLGRGGVTASAISESADRLAELQAENVELRAQLAAPTGLFFAGFEAAISSAAMYVEHHCKDGEQHAEAICGLGRPVVVPKVAPVRADTPTLFCPKCGVDRLAQVCQQRENCGLAGVASDNDK